MSTPDNDEFDDRVLTEMSRMFTEMGMPIDIEVLKKMMRQVREQFETMGIDPEKMASSEIRMGIDSDPEEFRKNMETLLNGPGGMADLFRNMGINVQFEGASSNEPVAEVEVDVEEGEETEEIVNNLPIGDVFIHEDRMCITIDISRFTELAPEDIELNLTGGGEILQLMKTTQMQPLNRYTLPYAADNIVEWDLNNGILDVKFDITPDAVAAADVRE